MFKLHFFSVLEYSNEQQFVSSLHLSEQSRTDSSIDGLLPIWPKPEISPGINTNPSGQTIKSKKVVSSELERDIHIECSKQFK